MKLHGVDGVDADPHGAGEWPLSQSGSRSGLRLPGSLTWEATACVQRRWDGPFNTHWTSVRTG